MYIEKIGEPGDEATHNCTVRNNYLSENYEKEEGNM